ncbi:hypothetical protein GTY74_22665 [Streptomyces sp. SID8350]|nr:hypothetical protein [Streptomyces sp. SID8350]
MRAAAPHMGRGDSIVNISSVDGLMGQPGVLKLPRDRGHSMVMPRGCVGAVAGSRPG